MKKRKITIIILFAVITIFGCQNRDQDYFSIIMLPDTQNYSREFPCVYLKQTKWIVENREKLNILFTAHEGDVVDDVNAIDQWENADRAMKVLDGIVPYSITTGNHDVNYQAENHRGTGNFDKYFPVTRFADWCDGYFEKSIKNSYYIIDNEYIKLMLITLEFGPTEDAVNWADAVISSHSHYHVIVVTHCYMFCDNSRVGADDCWTTSSYKSGGMDGDTLWKNLISKHENIFLVQSGHILGDGLGRLTSSLDDGKVVHQLLANYQMKETGGNGWLRILKIYPGKGEIRVYTYTPLFDQYQKDAENQFILKYDFKEETD